jgi:hypothetical protein
MKNLIKIAFVFVLAIVTLASCSKDQNCVNWLEGDWTVKSFVITDANGSSYNIINSSTTGKMKFGKYEVSKDEFGDLSLIITTSSPLGSFSDTTLSEYKISDDCKTFSAREKGTTNFDASDILESSSKKMVFESVDSSNTKTTVTIEK